MSTGVVALYNVALLANTQSIAHLASNQEDVRHALLQIVWVLAPHGQTRCAAPLTKLRARGHVASRTLCAAEDASMDSAHNDQEPSDGKHAHNDRESCPMSA